jgi:hypothetical protein
MIACNPAERNKRVSWGYEPSGGRTSPLVRALVRTRSSSSRSFCSSRNLNLRPQGEKIGMQVAAAIARKNAMMARTSVELAFPISCLRKNAIAIAIATDAPIKRYRIRFIDVARDRQSTGIGAGHGTAVVGTRPGNLWIWLNFA